MHDAGKVILGLGIFLALVTFPIWFTVATGNYGYTPELQMPEGYTQCVESKEYMTSWHMDLLDQWRDEVVREGKRYYVSKTYGDKHEMSLTKNCMKCHNDKAQFCDKCHNYLGVEPYCWDCHIEPEGN